MGAPKMTITQKKARLKAAQNELNMLQKEVRVLTEEIAEHESPHKVGEIITWKHGKGRRKGRILRMKPSSYSIGFVVELIKADGSKGLQMNLYGFEYEGIQAYKPEGK